MNFCVTEQFDSRNFLLTVVLRLSADSEHLTPADLFVCAALSSCFASLLTQPADVLKTRRQMFPWIPISYRFILKDIYEVNNYATASSFMRNQQSYNLLLRNMHRRYFIVQYTYRYQL